MVIGTISDFLRVPERYEMHAGSLRTYSLRVTRHPSRHGANPERFVQIGLLGLTEDEDIAQTSWIAPMQGWRGGLQPNYAG